MAIVGSIEPVGTTRDSATNCRIPIAITALKAMVLRVSIQGFAAAVGGLGEAGGLDWCIDLAIVLAGFRLSSSDHMTIGTILYDIPMTHTSTYLVA
jgi:hypothetical protein